MRRREFLRAIGGLAPLWALAASAEQTSVRTIGVLVRSAPGWQEFWQVFREALREFGYVEGTNIKFELRSDQGDISRLPALAAELVRLKVDVIVAWFTPAAIAAKQATKEIPIVCAICGDLVGTGLVQSLARPGGNLTGNSSLTAELSAKFVELLHEMMPSTRRVAVLANAPDPFSKVFLKQIQSAGKATRTAIDTIMIRHAEELDAAFTAMERSRPDAVIVQPSLPTKRVAELALSYRMPAICGSRQFVQDGGLMTYFAVEDDLYRRAAVFVNKILKGATPSELPVELPTKFELVLNLKTAKAIGLTIPPTFLAVADAVIE
jgi:putative tryptophan/tyrosine transport system substrate-binding protein